ncbi:uncharacterized protein LOC131693051 [Topomyia yanbarensis]|uniref:uncharacterized protein LOC131684332 n=1 Tax=Topomyia yanbarensis TaxID=2498891 RepID=UPI00273C141D|nr:uncharacterized protein LOC131684332 [Topomyia yanbarensis]XP_058824361.1 uncharacterized protein LOC131684332 [Topomyia yanbarensis]XP_058836516.1 uncharacterized protein LOC131693051 [Topomyia yanbarensis]
MDRLIDPKIYADVQSRGLVNRLVKYHDETQSPLNKSQSMTSLYSKPGQFPVWWRRNNSSIPLVRISPSEKSVFQADTRWNILREGSLLIPAEPHLKMVQTHRHEDEIDAENSVIAPSTELDADWIKKQCKEVDSGEAGTKQAREITYTASPPCRRSANQQLQTKKLCSKNNISSSLSSSLVMNTPKVEHVAHRPARLNVDVFLDAGNIECDGSS